jgi:hypothetical protein
MKRLSMTDDFEAMIRIMPFSEGGLKLVLNGIRWDFGYPEDPPGSSIYMIWPDFLDEYGSSRAKEDPLPVGIELLAAMTIVSPEMRSYHRERIHEGTLFYCHEGARRVASGRVTRITNMIR